MEKALVVWVEDQASQSQHCHNLKPNTKESPVCLQFCEGWGRWRSWLQNRLKPEEISSWGLGKEVVFIPKKFKVKAVSVDAEAIANYLEDLAKIIGEGGYSKQPTSM